MSIWQNYWYEASVKNTPLSRYSSNPCTAHEFIFPSLHCGLIMHFNSYSVFTLFSIRNRLTKVSQRWALVSIYNWVPIELDWCKFYVLAFVVSLGYPIFPTFQTRESLNTYLNGGDCFLAASCNYTHSSMLFICFIENNFPWYIKYYHKLWHK